MPTRLPVVFLMGPTGCGKTDVALFLCQQIPCEIVSVDSMLVYRGMDIGTAKPSLESRTRFPHHMIDILDPSEKYSVARFKDEAKQIIDQIHFRQRLPILVGGTMFYFHILEHGLDEIPDIDDTLRARIKRLGVAYGTNFLYRMLMKVDAKTAERLHQNDTQRIERALGVLFSSKRSLLDIQSGTAEALACPIIKFALNYRDRSILHKRVEERFHQMLEDGLVDETIALMLRGDLNSHLPAMRAVGYAQVRSYLTGLINYAMMRYRSICATRQLIKRQLTWMRSMGNIQEYYIDVKSAEEISVEIVNHLHKRLQWQH